MQELAPLAGATWRKSGVSGDGNCVEVAAVPDVVGVRDSKDINGAVLAFTSTAWTEFLDGVKNGRFDQR